MGYPQGDLSLPLTHMSYAGVCFLLPDSHVAAMFTKGDQLWGFATLQPFRVYTWQTYVPPDDGMWHMPGVC